MRRFIHNFDSFLNEAIANLAVMPVGLKGQEFVVKINGKEYGYTEKEGDLSIKEISDKFKKLLKYSSGRALAWLKKHTELSTGSAKNESEDLEFLQFDASLFEDDDFEVEDDETEEIEESAKKEEKKEKKEKEEKEEKKEDDEDEEVEDFTPTTAKEFVKDYREKRRDHLSKKEKAQFEKLEEILEVFIRERRGAGRNY